MIESDDTVDIQIRLFNNRFSWRWPKFTSNKRVVARILQQTRENLGYDPNSKFHEIHFKNIREQKRDGENVYYQGTGEWFLDTKMLQQSHNLDSNAANEKLSDAFMDACDLIGDEEGYSFEFKIMDMVTGAKWSDQDQEQNGDS